MLTLPLEKGLALSAIPVIFTSFGFHGSVPSIVSYMNGDIRKLRRVFMIGSAIPLIAYTQRGDLFHPEIEGQDERIPKQVRDDEPFGGFAGFVL